MADINFDDLFGNFTAKDALAVTESKKNSNGSRNPDIYKPSINDEKSVNMTYSAVGRFVPYIDENYNRHTVFCRWECYLKDVNGENGIFVVSPKTDNKRCPIRNLSYQLFKSENAIDKANSKKINVYQQYYALFQVIKDTQHPEYNGKIMIMQFGSKINDKVEAAMKSSEFSDGFNPFDFGQARLFEIKLKKGDQKMDNGRAVANYDDCRFIDKTAPITFGDGQVLGSDAESRQAYIKWLRDGAPKISEYQFKEWDAETTEKVNTLLATYTSGYTAPRSTVAAAKEAVDIISQIGGSSTHVEPEDVPYNTKEDKDDDVTEIHNDDDLSEWADSILNG